MPPKVPWQFGAGIRAVSTIPGSSRTGARSDNDTATPHSERFFVRFSHGSSLNMVADDDGQDLGPLALDLRVWARHKLVCSDTQTPERTDNLGLNAQLGASHEELRIRGLGVGQSTL